MIEQAQWLNADAAPDLRLSTCDVASNLAEIPAYGTTVVLEDRPE